MFFNLFGMVAVGFGVAGLILIAFKTIRRSPPKYLIPLAAGTSMLVFSVWNDYSWYGRTVEGLPPEIKVVKTFTYTAPWAPWTYAAPRINRFMAVDTTKTRQNPDHPGYYLTEVVLVHNDDATNVIDILFDCNKLRRADMLPSTQFGDDGLPVNVQWVSNDPVDPDPLITFICN